MQIYAHEIMSMLNNSLTSEISIYECQVYVYAMNSILMNHLITVQRFNPKSFTIWWSFNCIEYIKFQQSLNVSQIYQNFSYEYSEAYLLVLVFLLNLSNKLIIIFSYSYKVKKVLFCGQIFEMEILMNLHVLKAHESKNHIYSS